LKGICLNFTERRKCLSFRILFNSGLGRNEAIIACIFNIPDMWRFARSVWFHFPGKGSERETFFLNQVSAMYKINYPDEGDLVEIWNLLVGSSLFTYDYKNRRNNNKNLHVYKYSHIFVMKDWLKMGVRKRAQRAFDWIQTQTRNEYDFQIYGFRYTVEIKTILLWKRYL